MKSFKYLGSTMAWTAICIEVIKSRISTGKRTSEKVRELLTARRDMLHVLFGIWFYIAV